MDIENSMVADWWQNEEEYRIPNKRRLKRQHEAYEEAEREEE